MPRSRGRSSGEKTARAPIAPSTWKCRPSARAKAASAGRSSMAPVLTVPALPTRAMGRNPARRSSSTRRARSRRSMRYSESTGTRRSAVPAQAQKLHRLRRPSCGPRSTRRPSSAAAPPGPRCRASKVARACRATARPTRLAMEPPLTRSPLASAGKPIASLNQSSTWSSTRLAPSSKPPTFGLSPAASISVRAVKGVPVPMTHPQKRGWMLPVAKGSTRCWKSRYAPSRPGRLAGGVRASAPALRWAAFARRVGRGPSSGDSGDHRPSVWPSRRSDSQSAGSSVSSTIVSWAAMTTWTPLDRAQSVI